jgi:hypothetical protein
VFDATLRPATRAGGLVVLVLCSHALAAATASAGDDASTAPPRRGPAPVHDEHLLAQPRLTLAPLSPDPLGRGRISLRASLAWANSFSWTQDVAGEAPADRRFLVDGESRTLDLTVAVGVTDGVDLALRVPVRWRGGGVLDGLIDAWHDLVGLPDGDRGRFRRNELRVEGLTTSGERFSWSPASGLGLGSLELAARVRLTHGDRDSWSLALAPRLGLPTATGPFQGDGLTFAAQAVAAKRFASAFDLELGAGAIAGGSRTVHRVGYARVRGHCFVAVEWRPGRRWSLVGETSAATRLVEGVDSYPGLHWTASLNALVDVSPRARLEMGFTENIKSQLSTPDFAVHFGIGVRP